MRTQHYSEDARRVIAANQAEIDGRSWRKLADGRAVSTACVVPAAALVGFAAVRGLLKWYMGLGRKR